MFRDRSSIHGLRDFFHFTGIIHGKAGISSVVGLVNSVFITIFIKLPASEVPSFDWCHSGATGRPQVVNVRFSEERSGRWRFGE